MEQEVRRKKEYLKKLFHEIYQKANSESGHKVNRTKKNIDPFAPGNLAEKHVLKFVERCSGRFPTKKN